MMGLAEVIEGTSGAGPQAMTDALGHPFWRFEGSEYLTVAQDLVLDTRQSAVFMVGRFHRVSNKCPVFSLGSQAAGNGANTLGAAFEASSLSRSAPLLRAYSYPRNANDTGAEWMVAGSQMQVTGMTGRTTANGATRLWVNDRSVQVAQPYNVTGITGAEIGRYARTPGAAGSWGTFDLYEMIVCDRALTDAEGDAMQAALMAHYAIPQITDQLVLEGDSIMQGTGDVTTGQAASMILTEPGRTHIGANWRVVNMGTSGNRVSHLEDKRDAAGSWTDLTLPGRNVVAVEIGRNDFGGGGQTAAEHYANVTGYLTTSGTGVLPRGWEVRMMANIASSPALQVEIDAFRAMLRDPQFLADTQSAVGQSYAGQVSIIATDLIAHAGQSVFATSANAADVTYYAGDSTHPGPLGAQVRMTGGDTPGYGVAHGL